MGGMGLNACRSSVSWARTTDESDDQTLRLRQRSPSYFVGLTLGEEALKSVGTAFSGTSTGRWSVVPARLVW